MLGDLSVLTGCKKKAKRKAKRIAGHVEILFYRGFKAKQAVDGQLTLNGWSRSVGQDMMEMSIGMWGWMTHKLRGALPDPCKLMGG